MKLDEVVYYWWKDNHKFCRHWFVLKTLLRARYVPHLLYASEADYNEPDVEPEPELEVVAKLVPELEP